MFNQIGDSAFKCWEIIFSNYNVMKNSVSLSYIEERRLEASATTCVVNIENLDLLTNKQLAERVNLT